MAGLDDILNGSEETETATDTEAVTTEQETEQPEQETAQVDTGVAETQVAAETETSPEPDEVKGLKAAAAAERKKRQDIEAEYQQRVAALEQQLAQRQTQEEEPYIDEDVKTLVTQTESKFQQALVQQKLEMSESIARDQYADFDEKLDTFKELLKSDPNLYNRMVQQPNPAGWMYKTASDHQQMQKLKEIGDPVAYETSLRERLREELKAELAAEQAAATKQATEAAIRAKLPKSGFAEERSSGTARATPDRYNGATPMKSILG